MLGVITGDVVNSRKEDTPIWLNKLKSVLNQYGETPKDWEIFRGDTFQLKTSPTEVLRIAILIKAQLKQVKNLDVRMGIGIGAVDYESKNITESNGEAYINSGLSFNELGKRRLAIKTPWPPFDENWNLYLKLASLTMDTWAPKSAAIFKTALEQPEKTQMELARELKKSQSTISASLNRTGYDEIEEMLRKFSQNLENEYL